MVAIAQLVEHLIVVQKVARSSRVSHPKETSLSGRFFHIRRQGGAARDTVVVCCPAVMYHRKSCVPTMHLM